MNIKVDIKRCFFQVQQDRADVTLPYYSCSFARLSVVNCRPSTVDRIHMYTQYPMEASKFWNLLNLFTPESWFWIVGTIFVVVLSLKMSAYIGKKLGMRTQSIEICLVPFRSVIVSHFFSVCNVSKNDT